MVLSRGAQQPAGLIPHQYRTPVSQWKNSSCIVRLCHLSKERRAGIRVRSVQLAQMRHTAIATGVRSSSVFQT